MIDTPGHTRGHIAFFFPDGDVLLCGDTLFSLGCGRLLEGTAAQMFASLRKFASCRATRWSAAATNTPRATRRFALTVEPDNAALQARAAEVDAAARRRQADGAVADRRRRWPPTRSCARLMSRSSPTCARAKTSSETRRDVTVKLFYSPTSPFVRKVMACAITRGLDARSS